MHFSERIHSLYFWLPDLHRFGFPGKAAERVLAKVVKKVLDGTLPAYYRRTIDQFRLIERHEREPPRVICSLTTFPARIDQVWIAIESLFRQTVTPDKIILWLSIEQFPDRQLPLSLQELQNKGLEVEFCDGDLKAHKKYVYALRKYPNDLVVTYDDDSYYDRMNLENLLSIHRRYPHAIGTNRAHKITTHKRDGRVKPYRTWQHNVTEDRPSHRIFATGNNGVIYQAQFLEPEVTRKDLIRELCYYADDVWLKIMALRRGTPIVTNDRYGKDPITVGSSQKEKLVSSNVIGGGNDTQLERLMSHYDIKFIG